MKELNKLEFDGINNMGAVKSQVNQRLVWNTIQNHLHPLVPLLEELLAREVRGD